jgi:hypothetical protein
MGRKLIEHTLPEIARQLARVADAMEKSTVLEDTVILELEYYISDVNGHRVYNNQANIDKLAMKITELENKHNLCKI